MSGVGPALAGWPLAGLLAVWLFSERLRFGRRRASLNRALHELRRPLQQLALSPTWVSGRGSPDPVQLALAAVTQLDHEVNGSSGDTRLPVSARELAGAAVSRWSSWARRGGGSLELRWRAGTAAILGDPIRISQALDNLIVNALEHGGPTVIVEARSTGGRLRIAVADDGRAARRQRGGRPEAEVAACRNGHGPRGHGLEVVRAVASSHSGRFALQRSDSGSVAVLELPLVTLGGERAA